jgi:hypothetical protein
LLFCHRHVPCPVNELSIEGFVSVRKGCINVGSYFVGHPFVFPGVDEEVDHWPVAMDEAIGMGRMLPFFHCPEDWSPFWVV